MSSEQLSAFMEVVATNEGLQEKLKCVADFDGLAELARGAGFDVTKADCIKLQDQQIIELTDNDLDGLSGGGNNTGWLGFWCSTADGIC
jgi:predicted ribosomally synthesized peptide with nif11-like leader